MPVYDFICKQCGSVHFDVLAPSPEEGPVCCHRAADWLPSLRQITVPVHSSERSVVWRNPNTGEVRYPGRNDIPMPSKYAAMGYERQEICHDHEMRRFEKEHGVTNERANFDRNGRGSELPLPEVVLPVEVR